MIDVLLVEDEATSRQVLEEYLAAGGYRVHSAADGSDALNIARDLEPDLLLCDWLLPGDVSGLDVALSLKARFADMPILFMTGLPVETVRDAIGELRVVDVLAKPISLQHVRDAVERALGCDARRAEPRADDD